MLLDHSPLERGYPRKKKRLEILSIYFAYKSVNPSFFFFIKKKNPKGSRVESVHSLARGRVKGDFCLEKVSRRTVG